MNSIEWNSLDRREQDIILQFQRDYPVKIGSLAKSFGLSVLVSTLPAGVSGEIRPSVGAYQIKVNRHDSPRRQRFTLAHELAHFLLHRNEIGDGISDDVLYRSSLSDQREAQANRLAADILMPLDAIRKEAKSRENLQRAQLIEELSEVFSVSTAAMEIRLGFL
ncbi:ImmA/IrrE family metallo-endopeptidase [Xanthomonas sacchari]|uniref:ImmA/IrrE family metallo-endopeptidase n=1 Tax=Xanthomonas sacchari TaxID=56458 RepID=UPI00225DE8D6|nr:ImmA/IrrE family metallo-endopeptidase [Xanthomonas sacchari]UYK80393.1 ImmA/IrrE family metallo-endopeptidase [Xanthomonas sacchari]